MCFLNNYSLIEFYSKGLFSVNFGSSLTFSGCLQWQVWEFTKYVIFSYVAKSFYTQIYPEFMHLCRIHAWILAAYENVWQLICWIFKYVIILHLTILQLSWHHPINMNRNSHVWLLLMITVTTSGLFQCEVWTGVGQNESVLFKGLKVAAF